MAMSAENVAYLPPNAKAEKFVWQVKTANWRQALLVAASNDDEEIRTFHVKSYSEPKYWSLFLASSFE